jgi:hypothetical protein
MQILNNKNEPRDGFRVPTQLKPAKQQIETGALVALNILNTTFGL